MNKEKIKEFFAKLNNGYLIAAICAILIGVIVLGAMIGLVARPFAINTAYTAKVEKESLGETITVKSKLVLLDGGRYSLTVRDSTGKVTYFGDYAYGRIETGENASKHNIIRFEYDGSHAVFDSYVFGSKETVELTSPFKLQYGDVEFINVGGILLLVFYCFVIVGCAAIAAILIVKRKDGNIVFTDKLRLVKRLKEIEDMLGIKFE